jgi:hypothetical protein
VVFDSIETFVSFSSVWYVCVAVGRKMTMGQGSCQMKCAWQKSHGAMVEGCVAMQISRVLFGFQFQRDWEDWFLDLYFE